jgi:15-cis-phytoene synthase
MPAAREAASASGAPGVCRTVTKASRSNFAYAFLFLPKPQREALYAVYAFCRLSDDLVDEAAPALGAPGAAEARAAHLAAWRAELARCFQGAPTHPVTTRLAEILQRYPIPREYFEELLSGMEMDLGPVRYATFAELEGYCYRVAGVVGLMCIEIFGYRDPGTRIYAERLGTAFQLTNILRDLAKDAEAGRVYLPQEDLRRFGVDEADLTARRLTPAVRDMIRFELARARDCYAAAAAALPAADRRSMLPAQIMAAIYRRLLAQIEAREGDVFSRPIALSDLHRILLAIGCWARIRLTGC